MADDKAFEDDPLGGGSYSQLLFGDDDDVVGLDPVGCFNFNSHFSSENPSKLLCFGDYGKQSQDMVLVRPALKCGVTCSDSSPASSTTSDNNKINSLSKSNKKRNGSGKESSMLQNSTGGAVAAGGNQKNSKKAKADNLPAGHAKAKKVKLGERINALQQLVSPFGKTDTASVLHEAMGYIRFLHDQVQVLCSPYLQRLSSSDHLCEPIENGQGEPNKDLRSRGLCLVPVELTSHVAETNGADFWSPAMVNNDSCNQ